MELTPLNIKLNATLDLISIAKEGLTVEKLVFAFLPLKKTICDLDICRNFAAIKCNRLPRIALSKENMFFHHFDAIVPKLFFPPTILLRVSDTPQRDHDSGY